MKITYIIVNVCYSRVSKHKTSCLADACIIKLLWPNCMQILSVKRKILERKRNNTSDINMNDITFEPVI